MGSESGLTGNSFLDSLPQEVMARLRPLLSDAKLDSGAVLYEEDASTEVVYFPLASMLSNVLPMADGAVMEVGITGHEGMSGLVIALGQTSSNQRTIVQIPDSAKCMSVIDFRAALDMHSELMIVTLRYGQAVLMMSAQLSACNALHPIDERCARWFLMAHDRVDGNTFSLTQEFLSQMLGVRRGGVTLAASTMQRAGFISYSRGRVTIRDREGLESAACECYADIDRHWRGLMGYSSNKHSASSFKLRNGATKFNDIPPDHSAPGC